MTNTKVKYNTFNLKVNIKVQEQRLGFYLR